MDKEAVKAKRIAGLEKARRLKKEKKDAEKHAVVASITGVESDVEMRLLKEISDLKAKLAVAETARSAAEQDALATAQAQGMLMQRQIEEVPTGKTVKLQRLKEYKVVGHKDSGDEILKPVFHAVSIPTYFYKIDMPPCGGVDMKINGASYYHGAVYEFDLDTLRTVKEMMYRLWKHDADIHGSDENAYRKPQRTRLSARGMA